MVVSNREIANTNIISFISAMSNPFKSKAVSKDTQIDVPRGKTIISSMNSLRESSVMSKASSIKYATHIKAQSIDPN